MAFSLKQKKIFAIVIGLLFLFFLNFFSFQIKSLFYLISSPIQKQLWREGQKISGFFSAISKVQKLKEEKENLQLKNQELLVEILNLKEIEKENEITC